MKKCCVIINPTASHVQRDYNLKKKISNILNKNFHLYFLYSRYPGHVTKLVKHRNGKYDVIVTVGGDGTFGEATRGFSGQEQLSLYCHIPYGTTNDVKTMLGLSNTLEQNLKNIIDGDVLNIDIMAVNNMSFSYVAGFGFPTYVPALTSIEAKKIFGPLAYVFRGLSDFMRKVPTYHIKYKIDGVVHELKCIIGVISNSKQFAGMKVYKNRADICDGLFEICFVPAMSKSKLMKLALQLLVENKDLSECKGDLIFHQARNLEILFLEKTDSINLILDGDESDIILDKLAFNMKGTLKIIIPK